VAYRPEDIYQDVNNIAPDLIVHFGDLTWRSVGSIGHPCLHVQENDTGPDDCNHAQFGAFILAAPGGAPSGEVDGAHLLQLAPTLLELGGFDVPDSMSGGSGLPAHAAAPVHDLVVSESDEEVIRQRLTGLGYIE
jgi:predicted AlkP superfamily phosphohydrolase/phosphomutase